LPSRSALTKLFGQAIDAKENNKTNPTKLRKFKMLVASH
jgi:hypothetical protein